MSHCIACTVYNLTPPQTLATKLSKKDQNFKQIKFLFFFAFSDQFFHLSEERAIDIGDLEDDFNSNDFKHHPNDNRNGGFGSRVISRISEENESNLSLEEDTAGSQLVNAFETRNGIFYEL